MEQKQLDKIYMQFKELLNDDYIKVIEDINSFGYNILMKKGRLYLPSDVINDDGIIDGDFLNKQIDIINNL